MAKYQGNDLLDVVDMQDNTIGQATRREIHEKSLTHRSVHILVFNSEGDLFMQKRAMSKDENPGMWDTSAAGHVDSGETYVASAHRELREELGIEAVLKAFLKLQAEAETGWEHVTVYSCVADRIIVIDLEEISEGRFWKISEIRESLNQSPAQFTSTFKTIFQQYLVSEWEKHSVSH